MVLQGIVNFACHIIVRNILCPLMGMLESLEDFQTKNVAFVDGKALVIGIE